MASRLPVGVSWQLYVGAMKRLTSDRWLILGAAFSTIGGTLFAGYWIYVLQASPRGGFWQAPAYTGASSLAFGLALMLVGFFAPSSGVASSSGRSEHRQRLRRRQRFAKDIRRKLQQLEGREWSDERFTELEAQVIIERTTRSRFAMLNLRRPGRALRYQRSLSKALRSSKDELILLQGDPGCGKSVALRHVALAMAESAAGSRKIDAVIPLYINLKGLRTQRQPVDANLIQQYVDATLRDDINADVERFLDAEFERGLTDGTWFFLFDSFDEMPAVLGSSRLDDTVRQHSEAIATFLGGMRPCRGVVASREFHSPKGLPWPRWQIRPLTGKRQRTLIGRYLIDADKEGLLLAGLDAADPAIVQDGSNPLFLSLLAEYVRQSDSFPASSHQVYETYIAQRFAVDAERVLERFGVPAQDVRGLAERAAFCMSSEEGLGLEPTRGELLDALERSGLAEPRIAMACMDALEYLKLVQGQPDGSDSRARVFTFAHRRFQEYFTTAAVLGGVGEISSDMLLTDLRWRETAVTLCQLQRDSATALVERADEMLGAGVETLQAIAESEPNGIAGKAPGMPTEPELWPNSAIEVLTILQAGFSSDPERLPDGVRARAGLLLAHVFAHGFTYDRATAVSVAATAPRSTFDTIIRDAFTSGSQLLADEAYRQVSRLRSLPDDLASEIRRTLLRMTADGTLRRESLTVKAQLRRFDSATRLLRAQRVALIAPRVDAFVLLAFVCTAITWRHFALNPVFYVFLVGIAMLTHSALYGLAAQLGGASYGKRLGVKDATIFVFILRAYLLTVPFLGKNWSLPGDLPIFGVSLFAIFWAPAALLAVRNGDFLDPPAYPLVFLSPVRTAARTRRSLGNATALATVLLLLIAMGVGAVFGLKVVKSIVPKTVVEMIGIAASVAYASWSLYKFWSSGRARLRDMLWYRRWDSRAPTALGLSELMRVLAETRTLDTVTRVLADVRTRQLLLPEPDVLVFLGDLARAAPQAGRSDSSVTAWQTHGFAPWLAKTPLSTSGAAAATRSLEDEIARLVRALKEQRVKHA
jgi:hypothetical protein